MNTFRSLTSVTGVVLGMSLSTALAVPALAVESAGDDVTQLKARLQAVEAQLAQVRQTQGEQWLNERRAEEIKALVREVISDADTRASLAQDTVTAGYKNGFFIGSEDGNYRLFIRGELQFRYLFNNRDDVAAGQDGTRGGFEASRTRFGFSGNVVDPSWTYCIWTGYGADGNNALLDMWLKKTFEGGWSVTAGQFKAPIWREWLVSETRQQVVERSLLNGVFGGDYTQGIMLGYQNTWLRAVASFNDGVRNRNVVWNSEDVDYGVSGRAEFLILGAWSQYEDFSAWPGEEPLLVLGGSVHHQQGEGGTTTTQANLVRWSVDGTLKFRRLSVLLAGVGNHVDTTTTGGPQYGMLAQVGYFVTDDIEVFSRYEWGELNAAGEDQLSIITTGATYFVRKHQLKMSVDVGYSLNRVTDGWDVATYGWLIDAAGKKGQILVRTQIQLLF